LQADLAAKEKERLRLEDQLSKDHDALEQISLELQALNDENDELRAQQQAAAADQARLQRELDDEKSHGMLELERLANSANERSVGDDRSRALQDENAKLASRERELLNRIRGMEDTLAQAQLQAVASEGKLRAAEDDLDRMQRRLAELQEDVAQSRRERSTTSNELVELKRTLTLSQDQERAARAKVDEAQREIECLKRLEQDPEVTRLLQRDLDGLQRDNDALNRELTDKERKLSRLERGAQERDTELEALRQRLRHAEEDNDVLGRDNSRLKQQVTEQDDLIKRLRDRIAEVRKVGGVIWPG
jgi:chromosome segregation ATPase